MAYIPINPVHRFENYEDWRNAIKQVKGDLLPLPFAWQFVEEKIQDFETFCEFVNTHHIENWVFDNGRDMRYLYFRLSQFKQVAREAGLEPETGFRVR